MGEDANRLLKKQDLVHLAILLVVALAIGGYLIATTVLIAKDGVVYIEYARRLAVEPVKTMHNVPLYPGYPSLIYFTNRIIGLFYRGNPFEGWIISAQCTSLVCKIIATVVLYLVGSLLVGQRMSFWAVLILTILPVPAKYGSDALTDWPHIMFLVTGFWLLLLGITDNKWWRFGLAGIIAGLGYLIRPECCQLVIYGGGWLLFNLVRPQNKMSRTKTVGALISLLAGFAVTTIPYMRIAGYIFPEQGIGALALFANIPGSATHATGQPGECSAGVVPVEIAKGIWKLASNICEISMYYFVPAMLTGIYCHFRKQTKYEEKFLITAFILLNVVMLLWLHCKHGYISKRHSFPLIVFTIFYVPIGLQILAARLKSRFPKDRLETNQKRQPWFLILLLFGVAICLPKLVRPIRIEKQAYRDAARWLKENSLQENLIAAPDRRIGFYAERPTIQILDDKIPEKAEYIVKIVKSQNDRLTSYRNLHQVYINKQNKKDNIIIIYKTM